MKKILPYIAIGLLAIALLYLLFGKKQQTFDGRITLNPKDKIPYGTYAAFNIFAKQYPTARLDINKQQPVNWTLLSGDSGSVGQVLIIVNSYFNPTTNDLNLLTGFAQKGNYIFISALTMNANAKRFFRLEEKDLDESPVRYDNIKVFDSFTVKLDTAVFQQPFAYSYPGLAYDNFFTKMDSSITYPIGYDEKGHANFLALNALKGKVFLHAAPIAFSNLFLLYSNNHQYLEKMLSLLPKDVNHIVWDEYFLYKKSTDEETDAKGLLSVFLQFKNFRWAFWLVIALVALYLLTEVKRKQKAIPAYPKPANDSLEFVTTVGKLYFEKGDHKNLADKLTFYFLDHVRQKFKLSTTEINTTFAEKLAHKSNVPLAEVSEIIENLHNIQLSETISGKQLLHYHQLLENFYKKA